MTFRRMILTVESALALPLLLLPATLTAQSITYAQSTFDPTQWSFSTVTSQGTTTTSQALLPAGGNPGDYWQHTFAIPSGNQTTRYRVANLNSTFLYNPATRGALESLMFSFDVLGGVSSGFSASVFGFFVPTIRQNGQIFFSTTFATPVSGWSSFSATLTGTSGWVDPNNQASALRPDFSSSGTEIMFGYIYTIGTSCSGSSCTAGSLEAGLDNFSVTATAVSSTTTVPEPSSYALMAAGLVGVLTMARRRR